VLLSAGLGLAGRLLPRLAGSPLLGLTGLSGALGGFRSFTLACGRGGGTGVSFGMLRTLAGAGDTSGQPLLLVRRNGGPGMAEVFTGERLLKGGGEGNSGDGIANGGIEISRSRGWVGGGELVCSSGSCRNLAGQRASHLGGAQTAATRFGFGAGGLDRLVEPIVAVDDDHFGKALAGHGRGTARPRSDPWFPGCRC
jgi:hypothetical protein